MCVVFGVLGAWASWHARAAGTIGMERKKCRRQSRETYANREPRERRQTIQPHGTPFGYMASNINCTMSIFWFAYIVWECASVCVLTAVRQYESSGQRDYIRMRCAMSLCILHVSQLNFWMYALDGRAVCVYSMFSPIQCIIICFVIYSPLSLSFSLYLFSFFVRRIKKEIKKQVRQQRHRRHEAISVVMSDKGKVCALHIDNYFGFFLSATLAPAMSNKKFGQMEMRPSRFHFQFRSERAAHDATQKLNVYSAAA